MKDKQLNVDLKLVMEKRRLDQALSIKEFAVAAGVSYSVAREWFHKPGFPSFHGVVFWSDFVEWRKEFVGLGMNKIPDANVASTLKSKIKFTGKAAQILAEAGCL